MFEALPEQRESTASIVHSKDQKIDIFLTILPVGAIEVEPHRPALLPNLVHHPAGKFDVGEGNLTEKPLNPAVIRVLPGIRVELLGQTLQVNATQANHGQNHRGHALRSGGMPGKELLDLGTKQFQWSALFTCLGHVVLSHHRKKPKTP